MSRYFEHWSLHGTRNPGESTLLEAAATLSSAMVDACGQMDYQDTWNILSDARDKVMSEWMRLYGAGLLGRMFRGEVAA